MKFLKKILIGIICLIALPFIVALFIPRTYTVSVTEVINKPQQEVYDFVKILDNQKKYSIWFMKDPNMSPSIEGKDGTIGAIQKWNSNNEEVGEGEQEITSLTPDRMDVELRFKRPFAGQAHAANIIRSLSANKTQLTTEFYSNESYPMNLPSYVFGKNMIAEAQKKNLLNLKRLLEK